MTDTSRWITPSQETPPGVDTAVAHPARIYDYWLGGKDNFGPDREIAEKVIDVFPEMPRGVRANRAFLSRSVRYLAAEAGMRQFLDIGTGIPARGNVHEVAQGVAPQSRIVYVDNDPIVLNHARALLTSTPQGATSYIDSDAGDVDKILQEAAATLDFEQPIAVTLLMILMLVPEPYDVVARLLAAVPSGSYLVISHPASDISTGGDISHAYELLNKAMGPVQGKLRSQDEVAAFFDGLEMVPPGLVQLHRWRPDPDDDVSYDIPAYSGIGRKP